jgi:hypothetical protein
MRMMRCGRYARVVRATCYVAPDGEPTEIGVAELASGRYRWTVAVHRGVDDNGGLVMDTKRRYGDRETAEAVFRGLAEKARRRQGWRRQVPQEAWLRRESVRAERFARCETVAVELARKIAAGGDDPARLVGWALLAAAGGNLGEDPPADLWSDPPGEKGAMFGLCMEAAEALAAGGETHSLAIALEQAADGRIEFAAREARIARRP